METLANQSKKEKKISKGLLIALGIGAVAVAILVGLASLKSSDAQIQEYALEGAFREGSPEFELQTKKIVIIKDPDRTIESITGLGTVMMSMTGRIRNNGDRVINGLEVKATVIDIAGNPLKDKTMIVIPKNIERLGPGEELSVQITIDGFDKKDDRANIRWKVTAIKVE